MPPRDEPPNRPAFPRVSATPPSAADADANRAALTRLSERFGVPAVDLSQVSFPLSNLELIPVEIARRHMVLPFLVRTDAIGLAMADPNEKRVLEELEFVSARRVFPYVALPDQINVAIEEAYAGRDRHESEYSGPAFNAAAPPAAGSVAAAQANASPPRSFPGRPAPPPAPPALAPSAPGTIAARAMPGKPNNTPSKVSVMAPFPPTDPRILALDDDDDFADPDLRSPPTSLAPGAHAPTLDSVFSPLESVRGRTVLVVDDEEDIRKLLRRVLEDKGYHVIEADRGSVALQLVKQYVPDGIVLDAMLPELHGFDICRRIKSSVRYGHIPILMISAVYRGWRFAEDLKTAYGVNAYIEKPFRIHDVINAVESMLAGAPKPDGRDPEALTAEADEALRAGMDAYKNGNLDVAVQQVEYAITLDPLSYRLHYHLALLVGRKGDVFRAIQELETAIDLNPRSFSALKNLAVLYQKAGFKHKAIEMWERAIGQSPDDETRGQLKEHLMSLL